MRSRGVFLFFVPKMCPKCDSLGATFVLIASQKVGATVETNQDYQNRINWLNIYASRLSRTFLAEESELICQMEIGIGRKISIFFVSPGVRLS